MKVTANRLPLFAVLIALLAATGIACQSKGPDGREILIQSDAPPPTAERATPAHPGPLAQMNELISRKRIDTNAPDWKRNLPRPPTVRFPKDRTLYWMIETNLGLLKIELFPDVAPKHVSTTMYLTQLGFYDNLTFHRIIPKFMAQGGDPAGDGTGDPGFRYRTEQHKRPKKHDKRGRVSTANAGPNTDGSQFFILFAKKADNLDGKHTVFGQLVEGEGTLAAMETMGSESGEPRVTIFIERAWIVEVLD